MCPVAVQAKWHSVTKPAKRNMLLRFHGHPRQVPRRSLPHIVWLQKCNSWILCTEWRGDSVCQGVCSTTSRPKNVHTLHPWLCSWQLGFCQLFSLFCRQLFAKGWHDRVHGVRPRSVCFHQRLHAMPELSKGQIRAQLGCAKLHDMRLWEEHSRGWLA